LDCPHALDIEVNQMDDEEEETTVEELLTHKSADDEKEKFRWLRMFLERSRSLAEKQGTDYAQCARTTERRQLSDPCEYRQHTLRR
jgi:hypothetical protein